MVHRPPALNPGRPGAIGGLPLLLVLAILEASWLAWFVMEPLPNVGAVARGTPFIRLNLLIRALPGVIPGVKLRESHLGGGLKALSHVENLPQRVPIVLAAGLIAASAIAAGLLVIRALRLRDRLDLRERLALGFGLGTTALGLATLAVGRLGLLHPGTIRAMLGLPIAVESALAILGRRRVVPGPAPGAGPGRWPTLGFAAVAGPFLLIMMLGAMLPSIDFDALEYHLQGPKEYYRAGRIAFLPHNVYTSMPFGVEMLHLIGMELVDDWWLGALVGQLLVALFAPATAAMVMLAAGRLGSSRAAWVAGVVYLTTPWVYRLAVLPYVEGPLCFYHAALVWAIVRARDLGLGDAPDRGRSVAGPSCAVGLLAGGAMAIKYPGLISAVIPGSAWAAVTAGRLRSPRAALGFAAGVGLAIGPWLAKNVVDTGNPVYPLGYAVFGGARWTPDRQAKWSAVHGPRSIEKGAFIRSIGDVAGRSDWQSPLYAALAPLALLRPGSRRAAGWLWGFAAYLFLTWWLLTHRLDRFWLPILPPLAVLAGLGSDWSPSRAWKVLLGSILGLAVGLNLAYCSTRLAGLNDWTGDLGELRRSVPEMLNPTLSRIDATLPPGARPLLVGPAAVFHMNHPALYNTVFDDDLFEGLTRGRSPEETRRGLGRLGVTHVFVDWQEIERYRSPGNYGFTPFVTPEVFARLVEAGALGAPSRVGLRQELYEVRPGPARAR